jgi:hypothetical protein
MSTLVAQTISNGTVSTSSANVIQGSAKAWVNYKGTVTRAINASYNVSSVTVNTTGDYTFNFTNAFASANYSVVGCCNYDNAGGMTDTAIGNQSTGSCRVICHDIAGGTKYDPFSMSVAVFSS